MHVDERDVVSVKGIIDASQEFRRGGLVSAESVETINSAVLGVGVPCEAEVLRFRNYFAEQLNQLGGARVVVEDRFHGPFNLSHFVRDRKQGWKKA